jgi:hypothetical protein
MKKGKKMMALVVKILIFSCCINRNFEMSPELVRILGTTSVTQRLVQRLFARAATFNSTK